MFLNTTGAQNTAVGANALVHNDSGSDNNAFGTNALFSNVEGAFNNAHGRNALAMNTGGENNAFGDLAMENNTSGSINTAIGDDALRNYVDGNFNVAIGDEAGTSLSSVSNCIAIGVPGAGPFADINNTCFIGSIYNQPVSDASTPKTQLCRSIQRVGYRPRRPSDLNTTFNRWTRPAKPFYALKPVIFKYNSDKTRRTHYGLIAEQVAEVNPDLVFRDNNGDIVDRALRTDQHDVAQRVPQSAQEDRDTGSDYCGVEVNSRAATEGNGSSDRADSKSERADPGKQACPATDRK